MSQGILSLTFECAVQAGEGRFSRMVFPGRSAVAGAPADWPEVLQPGSMNCRVLEFPANYSDMVGAGDRIAALDKHNGPFPPAFCIPREDIANNRVSPYARHHNPRMGIAQAWRCSVLVHDSGETFDAWHVRRVDGTYPPFHGIIELMADRKLRDAHGLQDGARIAITMFSQKHAYV